MGLTARKITKTSYAYTPSNQIPINRIMCLLNCPSHEVSQLSFPIVELAASKYKFSMKIERIQK